MPTRVDKKERRPLTVKWVGEPQAFGTGEGKVLRFNTEEGQQFEVFTQNLFKYITVGVELDADTELRIATGKDGTEYPHWVVTQLYKDGEALAKPRPSYTGRGTVTSPEQRASIEAQVAIKSLPELIDVANRIGKEGKFFDKLETAILWCDVKIRANIIAWCDKKIDANMQGKPAPQAEKPTKQSSAESSNGRTAGFEPENGGSSPPSASEGYTPGQLFAWIAGNMKWKNPSGARTWLVNVCKIPEERIDADPEGCKQEIAQLQGWSL